MKEGAGAIKNKETVGTIINVFRCDPEYVNELYLDYSCIIAFLSGFILLVCYYLQSLPDFMFLHAMQIYTYNVSNQFLVKQVN